MQGYEQRASVDFPEELSQVVKESNIRVVLSIMTMEDSHLEYMDMKTTFLHYNLEEDIFIYICISPKNTPEPTMKTWYTWYVD